MNKPFIVSEMSCNHLGSYDRAMKIVEAAADAGADAIKLQTWTPDTMCLDRSYTLDSGPWAGRTLVDLYQEAWTPWSWHKPIFDRAKELGIVAFSAPFDRESVDFLETLDCPMYKIASFELVDLPLIEYVASKGKPVIMSTGMADDMEIEDAYYAASQSPAVTMCICTSAYPADASHANLARLYGDCFVSDYVGLSDHTIGIGVSVAAVTLGATYIEKHLTLSRADGGPDAGFSMEPHEFAQLVTECHRAAAAIGEVRYGPSEGESTELRRSLYISQNVKAGEVLTEQNVRTARPALGLHPRHYRDVIGKKVKADARRGTPITFELID